MDKILAIEVRITGSNPVEALILNDNIMKVYIVLNEASYKDSSYFDVIEIFKNERDAEICVETNVKDLITNKVFEEDFEVYYDNEIEKMGFNCCKGALLLSKYGYYELLRIDERELS